jgi:predicted Zn-dependent protease
LTAATVCALGGFATHTTSYTLWRAGQYLDGGRLANAERLLVPLARGDDPRVILLLARLRALQGRPRSVVNMLAGRSRSEMPAEWFRLLGEAYQALGQDQEAWAALREALHRVPDDVPTLGRFALLTYRLTGLADALEPYGQLERLAPRDPAWPRAIGQIYLEIDRAGEAADAFGRALALTPADLDIRFERAEAEFLVGRLNECLSDLEFCRGGRPGDGRVETARAECLRALGRSGEATGSLDSLLQRDQKNVRALRVRAEIYLEAREDSWAIALLERAVAVDPNDWRVQYQLALAYSRTGRRKESLELMDRVKEEQAKYSSR